MYIETVMPVCSRRADELKIRDVCQLRASSRNNDRDISHRDTVHLPPDEDRDTACLLISFQCLLASADLTANATVQSRVRTTGTGVSCFQRLSRVVYTLLLGDGKVR